MILGDRQKLFAKYFGQFLVWLNQNGYEVTINEVLRSQAQAQLNAASGAGISNTLHLLKLAGDLNIFRNGKFLTTVEELRPVGEQWKSYNIDCCWGGDFHKPDADHYSLSYQGVK